MKLTKTYNYLYITFKQYKTTNSVNNRVSWQWLHISGLHW